MKRLRRRGGANCGRALNARKARKPESTGLANVTLGSVEQLHSQEERREGPCTNWNFRRRQDTDEVKGLKRRCRTWKTRQGVKADNEPPRNLWPSKKNSHPRNVRFSNTENMTLVSTLVPLYEQLLGKCKSSTPLLKKSQMWQEICDAVNSVGNKQRFVHHCKKRFNDIKRQLKNKLNREKRLQDNHAGPSTFQVFYTQYEEALKKVLPADITEGIELSDSDHLQELCSEEEADPSWCTLENGQRLLMREMSSPNLQNISEPEALQRPLNIGLRDEQWSMLPDLSPTVPEESSPVRSINISTGHIDLQPGRPVDPKIPKLHPSQYSIDQSPLHNMVNSTSNRSAHLRKVLKATQKLFQKSVMHSLKVLQSDVGHFNKCLEKSNSTADNLLRVERGRNSILHQMNIQLCKLARSIKHLENQQEAEHILLHDVPRRQQPSQTFYTSRRGGERIGASRQAGKVHHSLRITS